MNKNIQSSHISPFEQIKRTDPDTGAEFWSSRDFAQVLGYSDYRAGKPHCESIELFELGVICK